MATVHSALTDLLDPLGDCMTPEAARKVVQLRVSTDSNSRMQLLAGKSTAGTLTDEERDEYEACVSAGTFIAILQVKARRMLGQNGLGRSAPDAGPGPGRRTMRILPESRRR